MLKKQRPYHFTTSCSGLAASFRTAWSPHHRLAFVRPARVCIRRERRQGSASASSPKTTLRTSGSSRSSCCNPSSRICRTAGRSRLLVLLSVIFLAPLFWIVASALKPQPQLFMWSPAWIPDPPQRQNFGDALMLFSFGSYISLKFQNVVMFPAPGYPHLAQLLTYRPCGSIGLKRGAG